MALLTKSSSSMHRQEHNLGPRSKSFQFLGRLKSVEAGHRDVENDDIGVEAGHSVQSFAPVCHRGHNVEFCLQRSRDGLQDPSVVVRQENSRSGNPRDGRWEVQHLQASIRRKVLNRR